jgi:hypothetical protein
MDTMTGLMLVISAAAIGMVATVSILRHDRLVALAAGYESPFAAATEGMKLCPSCGIGNLVADATCASCGKPLPG